METLQFRAFQYLKAIRHNWVYNTKFNPQLNYLDEAIENGFRSC